MNTQADKPFTSEEMDRIASTFERGDWPGSTTRILVGRPRLCEEPMKSIAARVPSSLVLAFDAKASSCGETRSQRLRKLIESDVMNA